MPKSVFLNQSYYEANRDAPNEFFVRHQSSLNLADRSHFHKNIEIICVKEGYIELEVEQKNTYTAGAGDMIFLDEWTLHKILRCDEGDYLLMAIPNTYSKQFRTLRKNRSYNNFVLKDNPHGLLFALTFSIYEYVRGDNSASRLTEEEIYRLQQTINALLAEIYMQADFTDTDRTTHEILPILAYIFDHTDSYFTIKDLAHRFGFTPRHLSRSFKEFSHNKTELKDYIDTVRLERAKTLLKQGESVNTAFEQSGFGSLRSFHRVFRESEGVTPGIYRKMHLNKSK